MIGFCSRNPDYPANPQRPQIFCSQNVAMKISVLWYELQGHYYIPCLVLDEEETQPIGMWGRKHLRYIKEHRPVLHSTLLKLNSHFAEIDNRATEMFDRLVNQLAEKEGITEQLKAQDQMAWVGAMNNIRNAAEEIVLSELIYC